MIKEVVYGDCRFHKPFEQAKAERKKKKLKKATKMVRKYIRDGSVMGLDYAYGWKDCLAWLLKKTK